MLKSIPLFACLLLALLGCGRDSANDRSAPEVQADADVAADTVVELDPAKGIDWFEGTVEEAFAAARESGRPIYLYWGAAWCPPCHAIAATVFRSPEFLERSKLFVPVYLDGDTENAQAYGEEFGVRGYPTMIVFDADGKELTRIPGGIDLQAYANILDLTLNDAAPVDTLVANVLADDATALAPADCTLLAYYSWGQDTAILADRDPVDAYRRMFEACPVGMAVERSILYFSWLDTVLAAAADTEDGAEPVALTAAQAQEARDRIAAVLADDRLLKANIFSMLFQAADYTTTLTETGGQQRAEMIAAFEDAFDRLANDDSVYKRERIYTLIGRIRLERIDDPEAELSAGLQQRIRDTVAWADSSTPGVYKRQPIVNALGNVLEVAGMDDVAKPLMLAELDRSKQPYYFMTALADIEQRAGNDDLALDWLKRAHAAAQGPATRFQWGYYYLNGLLEMAPDDTQLIHDTTVSLIEELQNSAGLYHRPKAQLQRLETLLIGWGEENGQEAAVADIRKSVMQVCASAARQDQARKTCEAFLGSA